MSTLDEYHRVNKFETKMKPREPQYIMHTQPKWETVSMLGKESEFYLIKTHKTEIGKCQPRDIDSLKTVVVYFLRKSKENHSVFTQTKSKSTQTRLTDVVFFFSFLIFYSNERIIRIK